VDWNDLRHFLALARHGSIRAAGKELSVSHTTVARRVEALEGRLGARLFDRHRDGYTLTEAGQRLRGAAGRVEDEVATPARDLAGRDQRLAGSVHLTCGDEVLAGLLVDDLAPWCAAHPGVDLVVSTDARMYNLAKGEADPAVRVLLPGHDPPAYLVGHRVAPLMVATYVAREHAARLLPPAPDARWLGYGDPRALATVLRSSAYPELPVWGSFTGVLPLVRAAVAGLGLVGLPTYMGDREPALRRLDEDDLRHVADIWLLHHPDLKANARVQAARAVLREAFVRRRRLFEGRRDDAP